MLKQLQEHLKSLQETNAPPEQIKNVQDMIKDEKERLNKVKSRDEKVMEAIRHSQMEGFKNHHQEIKMEMMVHNERMQILQNKINESADNANKLRLMQELATLEKEKEI